MGFEQDPSIIKLKRLNMNSDELKEPEEREWSRGLSDEVISLVNELKLKGNLGF